MDEPTDSALWQRPAAGEAAAFGTLFERHARTVYNYCFRRTGDWSQAEELTAIVFLEAWRRRRQVHLVRDEALPWLLGVATNVIRNYRRSQRRYRAALERLTLELNGAKPYGWRDDAQPRTGSQPRCCEVGPPGFEP